MILPWTTTNGSIRDWFPSAKETLGCILCRRISIRISLRVWREPTTCCPPF